MKFNITLKKCIHYAVMLTCPKASCSIIPDDSPDVFNNIIRQYAT